MSINPAKVFFLEGLMKDDPELIEKAIEAGFDIHQAPIGKPWIIQAVKRDKKEIVKTLIKHGIDLDTKDDDGWTALHHLCVEDKLGSNKDIMRLLLKAGANPNALDFFESDDPRLIHGSKGESPLMVAILYEKVDLLKMLIKAGGNLHAGHLRSAISRGVGKCAHLIMESMGDFNVNEVINAWPDDSLEPQHEQEFREIAAKILAERLNKAIPKTTSKTERMRL